MKVLILLLVLANGRGMPLGKNGASFQRKAEQRSHDNDLSAKSEAPLAPQHFLNERKSSLIFEQLSAENKAPLAFNHFSDENKAQITFKHLFPEIETLLALPSDENESPFISKHLSDEDEAPLKSFHSELISETLHLKKYKEVIINSEVYLRGYNFKYNKPDFAVDDQGFDDNDVDDDDDDDDGDDDDDDNYDDYDDNSDNYSDETFDDYDYYAENWADVVDDDDGVDLDLDVDDATNAILMILY